MGIRVQYFEFAAPVDSGWNEGGGTYITSEPTAFVCSRVMMDNKKIGSDSTESQQGL